MADQGENPPGGSGCRRPCAPRGALHGLPGGRLAPGSGLCLCADAAAGERGALLRLRRLLWRRRGLQPQRRRRRSGASPPPDSRSSGPPPPANSWLAHVTAGPTLPAAALPPPLPTPRPGAGPRRTRAGPDLRRAPGSRRGGSEGESHRGKWLPLCSIFIS